ncbi:1-acylglycerol-3-phosphate O-acyltransferase PNPLA3-like isoform X2 [Choloepus didactylus]|uniref:1-acylglycerol-3-phosphate O-acyltransferase PNPLA3-like isoform X2 n=1 Tax=Choloepus didactylus TaxID=27675 RepID=UPI00189CF378|nr:1-acylglycerol-3-phosphate O-acyltransferase PNPLA3-like isoform X2 [Choloepus didactylus]
MDDPERGWSLSFAGCGFVGFYHVGVTHCLSERAPHLLRDARMFFGCSAGALHCAAFLAGIPLDRTLQVLADLVRNARKRNLGVLHPSFNMSKYLREDLHKHLPDNIHQLISGKLCVSLTRVSDRENVLVSDFQSKEEVVDVLVCACFIPFYCGLIPPSFRGVRYMDGGLSDNVPFTDAQTTITVSPFYGEHDICPKVKSTNFLHVTLSKLSLRLCSENAYLIFRALFPPEVKVLGEICLQGYLDALRFLEEQGICTRPGPSLNLSTEESELEVIAPCEENMSQEAPWEAAALEMWPEGDELLETLCPKLLRALNEAVKDRGGYMSKMWNFFPMRIMSYMMLPCTLPVESVIALVQRSRKGACLSSWRHEHPVTWHKLRNQLEDSMKWPWLHTASAPIPHHHLGKLRPPRDWGHSSEGTELTRMLNHVNMVECRQSLLSF